MNKTTTGTGADTNKKFSVTVTLTAPQGVTLGNYIKDAATNVQSQKKISDLVITAGQITFKVQNGSEIVFKNIPYGTSYNVTETADNDYDSNVSFGDNAKLIDKNGASDTVTITNTKKQPQITSIVVTKVSSSDGNPRITGAVFALYDTEAHARAGGNDGKIDPAVNGAVYTFNNLQFNTTYYLLEVSPPSGYTIKNEITPITTNNSAAAKNVTVENDLIPIVMPETGGVPFTVNLTFLGILAMSLAGAALIIYKRKLQKAAVNTDQKGRRED